MRCAGIVAFVLSSAVCCLALPAAAGSVVDQIRTNGRLTCGSAIRPGLAYPGTDHVWRGINVDFCRAVAAAVIGPDAPIEFNGYALRKDFDRARGLDALTFLTTTEIFANELFGAVMPGPAVFYETTNLLVDDASPIRKVADIAGTMVCAEPGTTADRNLLGYVRSHGMAIKYSGWQEVEEMMDAFQAGRCPTVAGDLTAIAALRLTSLEQGKKVRIVGEPLAVAPVMATTPFIDPQWSAIVAWTIQTVIHADRAGAPQPDSTLPIDGSSLGLNGKWQERAIAATGGYSEMFSRSLGDDSPLELPRGVNARWDLGGLLVPSPVE